MDELAELAQSRIERSVLTSARKLSRRLGAVAVAFFSIVPFVIVAIAAWNARLSSEIALQGAFLLMLGQLFHLYRVFFRLLHRQADEIAALREGRDAAGRLP